MRRAVDVNAACYGFRVLGAPTEPRRLVDAGAALAAYASCDPRAQVDREAYLSAFQFPADFRDYLTSNGTPKGYVGPCWSGWLWFDLDADELAEALDGVRRLVGFALDRYRSLDDDDLLLFFSGSKGFHLGLPQTAEQSPSTEFHRVARRLAEQLGERAGVLIDTGVYDRIRLFRAPNSRHPRTGLHKRRLSVDELMGLSVEGIQQLAAEPRPFDLPTIGKADPVFLADWSAAVQAVEAADRARAERRQDLAPGAARLNRSTLDFIRDGAVVGDRHRLLFSAAANLGEFLCPPALAHALLSEPALDSGLSPSEVRRQIECGLSHSQNRGESVDE
jgi:hypothetical protein